MTEGIHCCRDDDDLAKAVRHMEALKVRRLPVINKSKRMVGILSLGDVSHSAPNDLLSECVKSVSAHQLGEILLYGRAKDGTDYRRQDHRKSAPEHDASTRRLSRKEATRRSGSDNNATMAKRIVSDHCCGVIIDVQRFFLAKVDKRLRSNIMTNTQNFVRLLGHFSIPIIVTLERPIGRKGALPQEIGKHLGFSETFEKNFFDLCKEKKIKGYLGRLKKQQVIVAGCETDVCVLQSCLGLLSLGYEVYVVEELLFSSSRNVDSAIARMKAEGAIFLTYKSLYYELVESVKDGRHTEKSLETFNLPDDLPDSAVQ
jgi:nicotinamidase-related amidase